MLDGEKAQRSEIARRLADVGRRVAQAQGGSGAADAALDAEREALDEALQRHSSQVGCTAAVRPFLSHPDPCTHALHHFLKPSDCSGADARP